MKENGHLFMRPFFKLLNESTYNYQKKERLLTEASNILILKRNTGFADTHIHEIFHAINNLCTSFHSN
jgi:hypothetical protein